MFETICFSLSTTSRGHTFKPLFVGCLDTFQSNMISYHLYDSPEVMNTFNNIIVYNSTMLWHQASNITTGQENFRYCLIVLPHKIIISILDHSDVHHGLDGVTGTSCVEHYVLQEGGNSCTQRAAYLWCGSCPWHHHSRQARPWHHP